MQQNRSFPDPIFSHVLLHFLENNDFQDLCKLKETLIKLVEEPVFAEHLVIPFQKAPIINTLQYIDTKFPNQFFWKANFLSDDLKTIHPNSSNKDAHKTKSILELQNPELVVDGERQIQNISRFENSDDINTNEPERFEVIIDYLNLVKLIIFVITVKWNMMA